MNINSRKLSLARCVLFFFVVEDSTFIALRKAPFFGSWVRNTGGDDWNESSEEM